MKLPPLNALRAFEAAARTNSFTAAGREINVTSAAISQQVRKLEEYLGRKLFFRDNNQLQLTDAGRDLYVNAAAALKQISNFTSGILRPSGPRPLVISALPSLAERWLPRHLARVQHLPLRLRIEDEPVDMEGHDIDIRFSYGANGYGEYRVQPLFQDALTPMATTGNAYSWDKTAPDFSTMRLIQMDWGVNFLRTPRWANWCAAAGIAPPETPMITAPGGAAALALAEAGAGVVLGQALLAKPALDQGRLIRLSTVTIPLPQPYMMIIAHARLQSRRVKAFLQALSLSEPA